MTIEQEFFEVFKLIECEKCNDKYCVNAGAEKYPTQCSKHKKVKITPEIMLKLMDIFLKKYGAFKFWICPYSEFTDSDGVKHKNIDCVVAETKEGNSNVNAVEISETRALLKLCIIFKHDIQDQVRGIFNA